MSLEFLLADRFAREKIMKTSFFPDDAITDRIYAAVSLSMLYLFDRIYLYKGRCAVSRRNSSVVEIEFATDILKKKCNQLADVLNLMQLPLVNVTFSR